MSYNPEVVITPGPQINVVQVATPGPQGPPGPSALTPVLTANLGAPNLGFLAFVTDATSTVFGTIVTGGGTNPVPVYADGFAWRIG